MKENYVIGVDFGTDSVRALIVNAANVASNGVSSSAEALPNKRTKKPIAAAFGATDIKAVIGVGAPSYASGAHMWNGTIANLKPRPAIIRINVRLKPKSGV